jgi:hypothetical protein
MRSYRCHYYAIYWLDIRWSWISLLWVDPRKVPNAINGNRTCSSSPKPVTVHGGGGGGGVVDWDYSNKVTALSQHYAITTWSIWWDEIKSCAVSVSALDQMEDSTHVQAPIASHPATTGYPAGWASDHRGEDENSQQHHQEDSYLLGYNAV